MKKLAVALFSLLLPALATAEAMPGEEYIVKAPISLTDKVQLQRGAQMFMNYCSGCHTLKYVRYERMATDLGIPADLLQGNLMFNTERVGDQIKNPIDPVQAKAWFGAAPPDLTLEGRYRGKDWIYSYLTSFYEDPTRPWGVNNRVFPNVGMPHVMGDLEKQLPADEFKAKMADITAFLEYTAEPVQVERMVIGGFVIAFLLVLLVFAWLMKREFWKDVH